MNAPGDPVGQEMRRSEIRTKVRKDRCGETADRPMILVPGGEANAPRPPAEPGPASDPYQNPVDPPPEIPLQPNPPHPGADPIELPTGPRQDRTSRASARHQHSRPRARRH